MYIYLYLYIYIYICIRHFSTVCFVVISCSTFTGVRFAAAASCTTCAPHMVYKYINTHKYFSKVSLAVI